MGILTMLGRKFENISSISAINENSLQQRAKRELSIDCIKFVINQT